MPVFLIREKIADLFAQKKHKKYKQILLEFGLKDSRPRQSYSDILLRKSSISENEYSLMIEDALGVAGKDFNLYILNHENWQTTHPSGRRPRETIVQIRSHRLDLPDLTPVCAGCPEGIRGEGYQDSLMVYRPLKVADPDELKQLIRVALATYYKLRAQENTEKLDVWKAKP